MAAERTSMGKRAQQADGDPGSPSPSESVSSRKRSAPSDGEEANEPAFDQLRINTGNIGTLNSDGTRDSICLCTPAPKIPRPRNAFILYRQHHQAQVTSDNAGLSNPEISKIIGIKWKEEKADVKENWKKLAEEEKQRHQQQYPDYRYQPRRGARGAANRTGTSPTEENERCPRCSGRIIMTPRTPATPFTASHAAGPELNRLGHSTIGRVDMDISRRHSIERFPPSRMPFSGQLPPVQGVGEVNPTSPEMKRRRANGSGHYHSVSLTGGYPYGARQPGDFGRQNPEGAAYSSPRFLGAPLPEPGTQLRRLSMAPPPRPSMPAGWMEGPPMDPRRGYDESVRLPPLQTSIPPSPRTALLDSRYTQTPSIAGSSSVSNSREGSPKSFQAQIMALPYKRKLEVLARVCQPAPALGTDNPHISTRGAFITVEGLDAEILAEVGGAVERGLLSSDVALKTWTGSSATNEPVKQEVTTSKPEGQAPQDQDLSQSEYFRTILEWRERSDQIESYITGRQDDLPSTERDSEPQQDRGPAAKESREKVPVALVKDGFSLTVTDRFAQKTSFGDKYGAVDHWQWMASLWRGTLCPDLVVYVKSAEEQEINQLGTVEFSKGMGMIVVRVRQSVGFDEGTQRRIIFEVSEWVREGSFRNPKARNWRQDG